MHFKPSTADLSPY